MARKEQEVWRPVVGFEGIYEVSSFGRVRTPEGKTTYTDHHGLRKWKQRIIQEKNKNSREVRVTLWKNGEGQDRYVHRLVAEAFLDRVPDKNFINHKDGNPRNNRPDNLEWCTAEENMNHAFDNGLMGTNNPVVLVHKETGAVELFRSQTKAGEFLGHGNTFIGRRIKEGRNESDGYVFYRAETAAELGIWPGEVPG